MAYKWRQGSRKRPEGLFQKLKSCPNVEVKKGGKRNVCKKGNENEHMAKSARQAIETSSNISVAEALLGRWLVHWITKEEKGSLKIIGKWQRR